MMISLPKTTDMYLATLDTEDKSPRTIDWQKARLKFFNAYMQQAYGQDIQLLEMTVDDGRHFTGGNTLNVHLSQG